MDGTRSTAPARLDPAKFRDPDRTAAGDARARVALTALNTLWINTGTLCNLSCASCYIESSPTNDRLSYITVGEVCAFLDEIAANALPTHEIGFTGGEPFMNPDFMAMLKETLRRGFRALVLTNAMKPMHHRKPALRALRDAYGEALVLRVSIDHYTPELHEKERGPGSWKPAIDGLEWLAAQGFALNVAGRGCWGEEEAAARAGYARLFACHGIPVDAADPAALVIFPEMDATQDVPEITEACWDILGIAPESVMCASSRMVVKRKGADRPAVVACTLLPYDPGFELGATLAEASGEIPLNHPHCARFCVLGGGSCSRG
jgi:uncharacterized Fe-S cluster-containing radical SAM superfamily protein